MRENNQPLLKPHQQTDDYGRRKYYDSEEIYIQPGDYVRMPNGTGCVEEIQYGENNQLQFRLQGQKRWHDQKYLINHLDYARFDWKRISTF